MYISTYSYTGANFNKLLRCYKNIVLIKAQQPQLVVATCCVAYKHIQDLDLLGLIQKILWINWSRYIFIQSMENRCAAVINVMCIVIGWAGTDNH